MKQELSHSWSVEIFTDKEDCRIWTLLSHSLVLPQWSVAITGNVSRCVIASCLGAATKRVCTPV